MKTQQKLRPAAWFLVHPPSHIIPAIFFPRDCMHCDIPGVFRDRIGARADEAAAQGATISRKAASPSRLRMSTGGGGLAGSGDDDEDGKDEAGIFDNMMDSPLYRSMPSRLLPTPRQHPSSSVTKTFPPPLQHTATQEIVFSTAPPTSGDISPAAANQDLIPEHRRR